MTSKKPSMARIAAGSVAALLTLSSAALSDDATAGTEGRTAAETIFASVDGTGKGRADLGDLMAFQKSVFAGMDYDGDGKVPYDEFSSWDPGFAYIADEAGRAEAYTTASKIVFAFWDRDGDGALTAREMRFAMSSDFRRADLDDDGLLERQEFIQGFPIIVAMRAAIRPDL